MENKKNGNRSAKKLTQAMINPVTKLYNLKVLYHNSILSCNFCVLPCVHRYTAREDSSISIFHSIC